MAATRVLFLETVLVVEDEVMKSLLLRHQHVLALGAIILISVIVMWPLSRPGLFTAHDIWHQVARFYHYHSSLEAGFWPPGWIATLANGYGYPLFYFSYHLPWLVGEVLLRLGFSIPAALKLLFAGGVALSAITMYWFCWNLTRKVWSALGGAVLYVIAPYHFLTVYVAAAIGSVFQFIFIPLLFLGIYQALVTRNKPLGAVVTGVGLAGSVLSHLMSTIMFMPFVAVWFTILWIWFAKKSKHEFQQTLLYIVFAGMVVLCLSAFYLIPLIVYKPAIIADTAGGFRSLYASNFVTVQQLVYSPWGFGPIISNAKDGEISMQIGVTQWMGVAGLVSLSGIAILLRLLRNAQSKSLFVMFRREVQSLFDLAALQKEKLLIIGLFVLACVSMLDVSAPIWQFANTFMTLDYPWRILLLAVFFGSTAVALSVRSLKSERWQAALVLLFIFFAWYTNRNHIGVNLYTDVPVEDYVQAETTTNTFAEYLPRGASDSMMRKSLPFVIEPSAIATLAAQTAVQVEASVIIGEDGLYTLRHYAFPTLGTDVDGVRTSTFTNKDGLIQVPLTAGNHMIAVYVTQPPLIFLSAMVSVVATTCLLGYILVKIVKVYGKK